MQTMRCESQRGMGSIIAFTVLVRTLCLEIERGYNRAQLCRGFITPVLCVPAILAAAATSKRRVIQYTPPRH